MWLQLLDVLLPRRINVCLKQHLHHQPGVFIAGIPDTQSLEISHPYQLFIEKCLHNGSTGAICQCDVKQYFDFLDVEKISSFLHVFCLLDLATLDYIYR